MYKKSLRRALWGVFCLLFVVAVTGHFENTYAQCTSLVPENVPGLMRLGLDTELPAGAADTFISTNHPVPTCVAQGAYNTIGSQGNSDGAVGTVLAVANSSAELSSYDSIYKLKSPGFGAFSQSGVTIHHAVVTIYDAYPEMIDRVYSNPRFDKNQQAYIIDRLERNFRPYRAWWHDGSRLIFIEAKSLEVRNKLINKVLALW